MSECERLQVVSEKVLSEKSFWKEKFAAGGF